MGINEIIPFATYVFIMSITPGPNNIMLTASGATFGYLRTTPHLLGVAIGCATQTVLVCLGFGLVFERYPVLHDVLRWVGAVYLAYLGWRLLFSSSFAPSETGQCAKPLSFLEAAVFQFVNPKAWMIAITAATVFVPQAYTASWGQVVIFVVLVVVNYPCATAWVLFGTGIGGFLSNPFRRRLFNGILASGLVATGAAMVLV